jgi:hypothetical protein
VNSLTVKDWPSSQPDLSFGACRYKRDLVSVLISRLPPAGFLQGCANEA